MNGQLTVTTSKNEIYFYTGCSYSYTKNDTAQINFVYESDFRKYNMIIGVNRDKLSLSVTAADADGYSESTFNVMTLAGGGATRHTAVEVEYLKFNFASEDVSVDFGQDFADIVLPCSYSVISQNPHTTIMRISCKKSAELKETI